ncbi:MAG: pyruvate kinase [Bacteroidetes bacterium HGW-Bacteroidetes-1]|jgi:pyruvate kinase|nr:MAG: pyruvate kinase [Bacteroidetes bacterium HGW-Bacteroidetes-1]
MKTKIIATIGPASSSDSILSEMIKAGMNLCRLNFSHGTHEDHKKVIDSVNKVNLTLVTPIAMLADLQGPKIRLGDIEDDFVPLSAGDRIIFTTKVCVGNKERVFISYPSFAADVRAGENILVDDGKMAFKVIKTNQNDEVLLESVNGGRLFPRKGVNLPDTLISLPSLTTKDLHDLDFIMKNEVQWIALSFVRSAVDIHILRHHIAAHPSLVKPRIVAKIEKPQAVKDIAAIVEASDAIMIARGDLGVEMPMQMVPMIQKRIIRQCQQAGKPVIVATQMMEAMIDNIRPTRAEVSDVANSVLDGADALMLSGETSVGKYPVETIATMHRIISQIEDYEDIYYKQPGQLPAYSERFISDAVLYNAVEMAHSTKAGAIVVVTHSGYSAFRLASYRPKAEIFVFSNSPQVLKTLNLVWGIRGFFDATIDDAEHLMQRINNHLLQNNFVQSGQYIINVLSTPAWKKGASNTVRLGIAGEE